MRLTQPQHYYFHLHSGSNKFDLRFSVAMSIFKTKQRGKIEASGKGKELLKSAVHG